jgi:hypothetical protein
MFKVHIKYTDAQGIVHYCPYEVRAKTREEAGTKALAAAARNRQTNASIHSTEQLY